MKKYIFLLMTTLLMTVFGSSPAWGQGSFSLVNGNALNFTPGTANTSVTNLSFTVGADETWTIVNRTYNDYTKSVKKSTVALTNNVPTAGTFITFTPTQAGKISLDIYWGTTKKTINAYESSAPTTSIASQSVGDTKESQTFTFDVEANKTYYVYAAGTGALELYGFTYEILSTNELMLSVEDMRYAAQKSGAALARTIRDFSFSFGGDLISYESSGNYTLLVRDNGSITITSNNSNVKILQVALYSNDVSNADRGDFKYGTNGTDKYLLYTNQSGTSSVTFTNGTSQNFNISYIWIQTDNAISKTKQNVTLTYNPAMGSTTVNQTDFSIAELTTTPSSFRADYALSDAGGTGTTFNKYH